MNFVRQRLLVQINHGKIDLSTFFSFYFQGIFFSVTKIKNVFMPNFLNKKINCKVKYSSLHFL